MPQELCAYPDRKVPAMNAITLWQPWAQLVAAGIRTIETRGHDRFRSLRPRKDAENAVAVPFSSFILPPSSLLLRPFAVKVRREGGRNGLARRLVLRGGVQSPRGAGFAERRREGGVRATW